MTNQLFVKMVLDTWNSKVKDTDKLFDELTDEQLQKEVSPNRNTGIYLLGHLTSVHDLMLPLLNLGESIYPQLLEPYIKNPDKKFPQSISTKDLRSFWKNANTRLAKGFNTLSPDDWFLKHNSVSVEDFAKEPHRNRLNIIISRTNHLSSHLGQLLFLKN